MTKINETGQLEFTFEELELEVVVAEVQKEYDLFRESLKTIDSVKYPRTYKSIVKRCNMLLDIRENIYKLMGCVS